MVSEGTAPPFSTFTMADNSRGAEGGDSSPVGQGMDSQTAGTAQGRNGAAGTAQGRNGAAGTAQGRNETVGTAQGRNETVGTAQGRNETGGLRARAASVYLSVKVRGRTIVVNIKHSVLSSLPRSRDDVDGWTKLLLGFIYCLFIVLGLAGFSLGILERGSLQTTRLTEPLFMLDSVEALERSSMITIAISVLFTIAGFLGCWGIMAKKRFLLTVHYIVLVLTLAPIIYHGFGQEAASGLSELSTKSPTMRIKLTHELTQDYGLDKVCGPPGVVCTTKRWDTIQTTRGCCGIAPQNANIYLQSDWFRNSTLGGTTTAPRVPKSCCARTQSGRYVNVTSCQMATTDVQARGARYSVGCDLMQAEDLRSMQLRLCVLSLLLALITLLLLILTLINNNAPMTRGGQYWSTQ